MKFLVLADIDDFRWRGGEGRADALLSCGDIADRVILEAAEAYGTPAIFAVKGNHDTDAPFPDPIVDLHLLVREFEGLKLGGMNGSWRYKPRGHFLYDQWEIEELLAEFPAVDIFLSHNSPRGIHDQDDDVHEGFDGLRSYLLRASPRVLIHGHQHVDRETVLGGTRTIGVCGHRVIEVEPPR